MARRKGKKQGPTPVEALSHNDTRPNIPTTELRGFVAEEEKQPRPLLYPRDPSLDPQLVWQGKDEQDSQDLAVPALPIYIQEKIEPRAIIEDLRRRSRQDSGELSLFEGFNGLEFDQLVDFYHHGVHWSNRLILGDSLLVMASLAEKENLRGQVQMIYIDPPYGIKFGSNWQVSTRKRDVRDGKAEDLTRQPEQVRAFRDTWEKGIHSYLAYLRDRLVLARDLLTDSGSIFVQIGDENVHLVRALLDEVFGSEAFCSLISFSKTTGQTHHLLAETSDYLLWYARDKAKVKYRQLFRPRPPIDNAQERYVFVETPAGEMIDLSVAQKSGAEPLPEGRIVKLENLTSQTGGPSSRFRVDLEGHSYVPSAQRGWSTNEQGMGRLRWGGFLCGRGSTLWWKSYRDHFPFRPVHNHWDDARTTGFSDPKVYVVQTGTRVIERCLLMTTDPGDLVLDPTCGSGTTAYVAEQWGRRWITIDTSRVALALARTRLMAARFPYYLLADSYEGQRQEAEILGRTVPELLSVAAGDVRKGFVYGRVP
ncbi:MAG: site-specific DNA-methyltransferase, partial [Thermoleophilia bacterium]|nr:site-specific DNA-methyltransferase [Thermoleophilia bacterium]